MLNRPTRWILACLACAGAADAAQAPLLKEFLGINGDFNFPTATYRPVCELARMYHNLNWDTTGPGGALSVPNCPNGVVWDRDTYTPWKNAGFTTDASIMVEQFTSGWSGKATWTAGYGQTMAAYFGPSGSRKLITSFEIGNEPGDRLDTATWKSIFKSLAQGLRAGDANVRIATPNIAVHATDGYCQDLRVTYPDADILPLYDVLNVHTYPFAPPRTAPNDNTFNQTYPEDPTTNYLSDVDAVIAWRNANAAGKEIWITEYGYDATVAAPITGWWHDSNWQPVSDLMQAQYLVRSVMAFTQRGIDRAYVFFYNDNDTQGYYTGGSGLTRNGTPKQSYWAMKQVYDLLGAYRFKRIVTRTAGDRFVYEFEKGTDANSLIWVAWSPTGTRSDTKAGYTQRSAAVTLTGLPGTVQQVIGMATTSGSAPSPAFTTSGSQVALTIGESPLYIVMRVSSANHPPTITTAKPAALACLEDGSGTVALNASDSDGDALTWTVSTQGGKGSATLPGGTATAKTLSYAPNANQNGGDTIVVTVSDGHGGSDTITVHATVTAVNDAPSFTAGPAITVASDSGARSVASWATALSAGPGNESGQALTFSVESNSNAALFSAAPTLSAGGTLGFTATAGTSGTATLGLRLSDNGGTANGGADRSALRSLSITITPAGGPGGSPGGPTPAPAIIPAAGGDGDGGGGCGAGGGLAVLLGLFGVLRSGLRSTARRQTGD